MRIRYAALILLAGCVPMQTQPVETTQQVPVDPFTQAQALAPTRVSFPPASREASYRVMLLKDQLVGKSPQIGLKPYAIAIASNEPEVFHVGNTIYITEALVRQCATDNQLAAALAYELGRMVAEREATVADQIRQPEHAPPFALPIGGGTNVSDTDPLYRIEMIQYEKAYPKQTGKLTPPNPQHVARVLLENAGYQRTDLDAVLPMLSNADRFRTLQNQFNGAPKQSEWKSP